MLNWLATTFLPGKDLRFSNKVDIVVSHIKEKTPEGKRLNARIIMVEIVLDIKLLNIINAYAPH